MGTAFVIDKNVSLTLASSTGTPSLVLGGDVRATGSITLTENVAARTRIYAADGSVKADVQTADPEFWGSLAVSIHVTGADYANTAGATLQHIGRALFKQDLTLIPGTSWVAPFAYDQGGGCDANVDLSIAVTYCAAGASVTKTLALGAVTVIDAPSVSFGESIADYAVTFQLLEEPDWTTWA